MVIVHEIRDADEEFESQLVLNDSIDDYTTDDDYEETDESERYGRNNKLLNFMSGLIPISVRSRLSIWSRKALKVSLNFAKLTGQTAWIITTSLLLIGLPLLYAYDREKSLVEYEKEQQRFAPPSFGPGKLRVTLMKCKLGGLRFYSSTNPNTDIHPDDFGTVPKLCHGLDRVLFNPGVHLLRDPRTNVYNYDPFLKSISQPEEFNFESIPKFVPPSLDKNLHNAAHKFESKFVSSTSSIAPSMSQFYFLISGLKAMNLSTRFTGGFEDEPQTFTQMCRSPTGVHLRPHRLDNSNSGSLIRSLVTEKTNMKEEPTILMRLGNVMEKLLTHSKNEFEGMLIGARKPFLPKNEETYNYLQASNFLLRSQLDCHDPRLPKKSFDLKTRATLPIRMDVHNHNNYLSYKLHRSFGLYESFEREFFDLCRSALLKYNFQVRIGDMDGIMIAYHNTAEIFGFQYLTRTEMDEILYGNEVTGDAIFKVVLKVYDEVLQSIVNLYQEDESLKLTFSLNKDGSKLTIFSEIEETESIGTSGTVSFYQFVLSVSNFINGFRCQDITLDPTGMDDWRVETCLQQVKPNLAEYDSARKKATEVRPSRVDEGVDPLAAGRVSIPIMRNARRMYPNQGNNLLNLEFDKGSEIIAPWTLL